jgi:hypothetical protein
MEKSIKELDLVSSQEAAIILKVSPATLRVWRCTGRLDILPHLSLTAAALVSGKEGDSFYAACKD